MRNVVVIAASLVLTACGSATPQPVPLQPGTACAYCRMTVSDQKLAAQIVAPGEEPQFFDDIGCLGGYLREHTSSPGAWAFVADHRSGTWVAADRAVYTRVDSLATPMGSHVVAHADARARDADRDVQGGQPLSVKDVFGTSRVPGGADAR